MLGLAQHAGREALKGSGPRGNALRLPVQLGIARAFQHFAGQQLTGRVDSQCQGQFAIQFLARMDWKRSGAQPFNFAPQAVVVRRIGFLARGRTDVAFLRPLVLLADAFVNLAQDVHQLTAFFFARSVCRVFG